MAGSVHAAARLLLLSFITTGGNGEEEGLIFAGRTYDITVPCEDAVFCFHIWRLSTSQLSNHVAIVSNGEIQTAQSEDMVSKCTLQINDLMAEDVGGRRCQQSPDVILPQSSPEIHLMFGQTASLQCILLASVEKQGCSAEEGEVSLTWIDEDDSEIQEDSQHQITWRSSCDTTLTLVLQRGEDKKFRCQATVGDQVEPSVELRVRFPVLKGRGRAITIDLGPEKQGGDQDAVGIGVGVAACVVLAALVALFVANRRRSDGRLENESLHSTGTNNVVNADNVIYADIILPVSPVRVWVTESETTEYACVR